MSNYNLTFLAIFGMLLIATVAAVASSLTIASDEDCIGYTDFWSE